jgi:hypothetical protein
MLFAVATTTDRLTTRDPLRAAAVAIMATPTEGNHDGVNLFNIQQLNKNQPRKQEVRPISAGRDLAGSDLASAGNGNMAMAVALGTLHCGSGWTWSRRVGSDHGGGGGGGSSGGGLRSGNGRLNSTSTSRGHASLPAWVGSTSYIHTRGPGVACAAAFGGGAAAPGRGGPRANAG